MLRQTRRTSPLVGLTAAVLLVSQAAAAQSRDNVLLVINERSAASQKIGSYYAAARGLADDHVVRITATIADAIDRSDYQATIEAPLAGWLSRHRLQDQILYIVLTKDVPLRVIGSGGIDGTTASVDSELTLLYRKLLGVDVRAIGRVDNPYYLGDKSLAQAKPFTRLNSDIYLVTRLDGFTAEDVVAMIDRGMAPARDGQVVLDQRAPLGGEVGDDWLRQAAERLTAIAAGDRVLLEASPAAASTSAPILGYASWGSNDPAHRTRRLALTFASGAIATLFTSADARTFAEPPVEWSPGNPRGRPPVFAGSDQTLAGDLIRDGITGVAAQVSEPYLDAALRPQVLFPSYFAGLNLAESFYSAMPYLSWQTVVIGDPLCAPFRRAVLSQDELAQPFDAELEVPGLFGQRRLAVLRQPGLNVEALKLKLKAESRVFAGSLEAEVEPLLTQAAALEPKLADIQMRLGMLAQSRGEMAPAMARYRQVLAVQPENAVALNNLALALSESPETRPEALTLAERAYRLAPVATIGDTLGWVHFLLGNYAAATPLIERAVSANPANTEFLIHAASLHAALNDKERARKELESAIKLDPKLIDRADVTALMAKIRDDVEARVRRRRSA